VPFAACAVVSASGASWFRLRMRSIEAVGKSKGVGRRVGLVHTYLSIPQCLKAECHDAGMLDKLTLDGSSRNGPW